MNCQEAKAYIHDYMDGQLDNGQTLRLMRHVRNCEQCERVMASFERTEALIRTLRPEAAPAGLKHSIMASLPAQRRSSWLRWIRKHPAISVAVVFLMVMISSLMSMWNQDDTLVVKVDDLEQVVINGRDVVVPEGKTVHGNLTVENGTLQVYGAVEGDLIIIDGSVLQASTAHIAGNVIQVNQMIDWIWYKISSFIGSLAQ